MAIITVSKVSESYDREGQLESMHFTTTIPDTLSPKQASDIIFEIVNTYFTTSEKTGSYGHNYWGTLTGFSRDIAQQRYCFSVGHHPNKNTDIDEFEFEF